jgi:hypothetical protein
MHWPPGPGRGVLVVAMIGIVRTISYAKQQAAVVCTPTTLSPF